MPPKRAASAKEKKTKAKTDNTSGDKKSLFCRHVPPPPKPLTIDEETKEYYLMQIRDLENKVTR